MDWVLTRSLSTVAMDQSALLEALNAAGVDERIRMAAQGICQELIEAEAEGVIGAGRWERAEGRTAIRIGSETRLLSRTAGNLELQIPKLRKGHAAQDLARGDLPGLHVLRLRMLSDERLAAERPEGPPLSVASVTPSTSCPVSTTTGYSSSSMSPTWCSYSASARSTASKASRRFAVGRMCQSGSTFLRESRRFAIRHIPPAIVSKS